MTLKGTLILKTAHQGVRFFFRLRVQEFSVGGVARCVRQVEAPSLSRVFHVLAPRGPFFCFLAVACGASMQA